MDHFSKNTQFGQIIRPHHCEAPCGPERIPFRVVMVLFAVGAMTFVLRRHGHLIAMARMAFFQAEAFEIGIVAAQGEPQKTAKCTSPPMHSGGKSVTPPASVAKARLEKVPSKTRNTFHGWS